MLEETRSTRSSFPTSAAFLAAKFFQVALLMLCFRFCHLMKPQMNIYDSLSFHSEMTRHLLMEIFFKRLVTMHAHQKTLKLTSLRQSEHQADPSCCLKSSPQD